MKKSKQTSMAKAMGNPSEIQVPLLDYPDAGSMCRLNSISYALPTDTGYNQYNSIKSRSTRYQLNCIR